jgi:hypothetical protein
MFTSAVDRLTHQAFHVIGFSVLQEQVDEHDRDEQGDGLEVGLRVSMLLVRGLEEMRSVKNEVLSGKKTYKEQSQVLTHWPGDQDE